MAVLTCEDLRTIYGLNLPGSKDAQWAELIRVAEAACLGWLGYDQFGTAGATEYFDDVAGSTIQLKLLPVKSATVWLNGRNGSWQEPLSQDAYRLESKTGTIRLYMSNRAGVDAIKVEYTYGWEPGEVPADVKACIAQTVQYLTRLTQTGQIGVTQRNTDGGTESIEQNIPPLAVRSVLLRYRPGRAS